MTLDDAFDVALAKQLDALAKDRAENAWLRCENEWLRRLVYECDRAFVTGAILPGGTLSAIHAIACDPNIERDEREERKEQEGTMPTLEESHEHIAQFFRFEHLPEHLQRVSQPFAELAAIILRDAPSNPERTVALRKLLESKDAAVRAVLAGAVPYRDRRSGPVEP